jgi:hypothetical protein
MLVCFNSLAYSGVKVALPAELTTGALFLQTYIHHILALQAKARRTSMDDNLILPLGWYLLLLCLLFDVIHSPDVVMI